MQHVYLLRHGQSEANANHIIAGSHDSPLSPTGILQAEYAGETIKRFIPIDLIVSSPMSRALQTAQIIADKLGYDTNAIEVIDALRERDLGDIEGKDYSVALHHTQDGNYEDVENVPGVEPINDLFQRVQGVLQLLASRPEKHILIVCHNGCGRMLKVAVAGEPAMAMYKQPRLDNAVLYKLR